MVLDGQCAVLQPIDENPHKDVDEEDVGESCKSAKWPLLQYSHHS